MVKKKPGHDRSHKIAWNKWGNKPVPFKLQGVYWPLKSWGPGAHVQYNKFPGRPIAPMKQMLFKGDWVEILEGKDTGKQGRISDVAPLTNRVKVERLNTKAEKMDVGDGMAAFMLIEQPLHNKEVALVNPATGLPMLDVEREWDENIQDYVRICNKSGAILNKPAPYGDWVDKKTAPEGDRDTPAEVMQQHTYIPTILRFHEEVMLENNIPFTVPKTAPDRRDFIMQELRNNMEKSQEQERLQRAAEGSQGGDGLMSRLMGFFGRGA